MSKTTQDEAIRLGARKVLTRAKAIGFRASTSGSDVATVRTIVETNIGRLARSDGRKAKGVARETYSVSGSVKKTGRGANQARSAAVRLAAEADRHTVYHHMLAHAVTTIKRAPNRTERKRVKRAVKLAVRAFDGGEIEAAINYLKYL